jgi:hypothetical protein
MAGNSSGSLSFPKAYIPHNKKIITIKSRKMILITLFYQTVPVCPARIESAFEMKGWRLMPMLRKTC